MKVLVLNTKKGEFPSEKTGEMISFTTTTIGRIAEESPNFSGYVIEEITGKVQDFETLKKYVGKMVEVDIDYRKVDKKNYRAKLISIDGLPLINT